MLAYHWAGAGDEAKEGQYAAQAGEEAVRMNAGLGGNPLPRACAGVES